MKRSHEGAIRAFTHSSQAYYWSAIHHSDLVDEVVFGLYHPEGGTSGEMQMSWERLGGRPVPQLRIFDDGWDAFHTFAPLLTPLLAERDSDKITAEVFVEILKGIGFIDKTQLHPPQPPRRADDMPRKPWSEFTHAELVDLIEQMLAANEAKQPPVAFMEENGGFTLDAEHAQRANERGCRFRPLVWGEDDEHAV